MNNIFKSMTSQISECKNDYEKAEYLYQILVNRSTNGDANNEDYKTLRQYFLNREDTKIKVPDWVRKNRDLAEFWQFIKNRIEGYAPRRSFLKEEFGPLLDYLENGKVEPHIDSVDEGLKILNSDYIGQTWTKALQRKDTDPDGAITISRTLMESVLKHILDELKVPYSKDVDLHEIYKLVSIELNLSPEQHNEKVFKQILGGCTGIVSGLGILRNDMGDAHGKGKKIYQPSERHAELAVNIAGTMCLFILKTFEHTRNKEGAF
jgi:hypothetical protein